MQHMRSIIKYNTNKIIQILHKYSSQTMQIYTKYWKITDLISSDAQNNLYVPGQIQDFQIEGCKILLSHSAHSKREAWSRSPTAGVQGPLKSPGSYTGWPNKNGTVDTVEFSGLYSDQQLSFFTLLDRASFFHYNNTKIIKFGWELFILWVISYGLSFSGFARFPEFRGTINHKLMANPENDSP